MSLIDNKYPGLKHLPRKEQLELAYELQVLAGMNPRKVHMFHPGSGESMCDPRIYRNKMLCLITRTKSEVTCEKCLFQIQKWEKEYGDLG